MNVTPSGPMQRKWCSSTQASSTSGQGSICVHNIRTLLPRQMIPKASNDPNFCLENLHGNQTLKRTHPYFFQVQAQMALCNVAYCDFVVWTPLSMHIERVLRDEAFFDSVPAAKKLFTHVIMPELFAAYFTRKATTNKCTDNIENAYCFCRGPESGKMLACDDPECKYQWFHYTCIGITRAPKQKHWYCKEK